MCLDRTYSYKVEHQKMNVLRVRIVLDNSDNKYRVKDIRLILNRIHLEQRISLIWIIRNRTDTNIK